MGACPLSQNFTSFLRNLFAQSAILKATAELYSSHIPFDYVGPTMVAIFMFYEVALKIVCYLKKNIQ